MLFHKQRISKDRHSKFLTMLLDNKIKTKVQKLFAKMQNREDLLNLLNFVREVAMKNYDVPLSIQQLNYYSFPQSAKKKYKSFVIAKKSGGVREINAPTHTLKTLQKTLNIVFHSLFIPHYSAKGFVPNKSIVDNAALHIGSNYVLNIDLKDFFTSIKQARVWACLKNPPFNLNGDRQILANMIATGNPSLNCILVDNATNAAGYSNWFKDSWGYYSSTPCPTPCFVNIPDANFKAALLANTAINTNGDIEIQCSEAIAFRGFINVNGNSIFVNGIIRNLTGIEAFVNIDSLDCNSNALTSLNVAANTALTFLNCSENRITSLNVSTNTALTTLRCGETGISTLNLSSNTALKTLDCSDINLSALNVSSNTALTNLNCSDNLITSLNVSSNTALTTLRCDNNNLTSLNVSSNTALIDLSCGNNAITSLNVSSNTALKSLICRITRITSLDISSNTALTFLDCNGNSRGGGSGVGLLTYLNLKNGNNSAISFMNAQGNPNLTCIQVDTVANANGYSGWVKDAGATYNTFCVAPCFVTSSTFTVAACGSYTWVAKGNKVYTANNTTDTIKLVNAGGCDSIVTLNLTINNPKSDTTASVCNKFTWRSITYYNTGDKIFILTGAGVGGCDSVITLHLTILTVPNTFSKTDAVCNGSATGSIIIVPIGGTGPYTYRVGTVGPITSASGTFNNLKAGTYRAYVQDAKGCIGVAAPITIVQGGKISASATANPVTGCNGNSNGSLVITNPVGTAPFQYKLFTSGSYASFTAPQTVTRLVAGKYGIYIKDANGCEGPANVVSITQPGKVAATFSKVNATCPSAKNGSITATGTGGTPPYQYKLNTTGAYGITNSFTGLLAGNYKVYVKDVNGCEGVSVVINISYNTNQCIPFTPFARMTYNATTDKGFNVTLSPNPTTNLFTLTAHSSNTQPVSIKVMDAVGKMIYEATSNAEQTFRFGENFANGLYMIEVRQGIEVKMMKAVKGR